MISFYVISQPCIDFVVNSSVVTFPCFHTYGIVNQSKYIAVVFEALVPIDLLFLCLVYFIIYSLDY
jgi:hypothetical protein